MAPVSCQSRGLRRLRAAILAELEPEILLALKLAVYQAAGYNRAEVARLLGATPPQMRVAALMVKRAAARLDSGDASSPWAG